MRTIDERLVAAVARHFEKADELLVRLAKRGTLDNITYVGSRLASLREEFTELVVIPLVNEESDED
jgi:acetate kinase